MSGGRATLQARSGDKVGNQSGDLSPIGAEAMEFANLFTVECKSYQDIYLPDIVYGIRKGDGIGKFWEQAHEDAQQAGKRPILVAKQNFKSEIILLEKDLVEKLDTSNFHTTTTTRLDASIIKLDEFLENVTPEELVSHAR